ncbi:hypothetical protein [Chryseobacterium sp.]|uniref:hypothetical protein n=1 Tax=Chryseobacterium sp. TaxID=1871047 RepID=UPI002FC79512
MSNWEDFEKECCEHLNKTYGCNGVSFSTSGASDSTAPDIEVTKNNNKLFNIEVKMPQAQSGQFVVLERDGLFVFSDKNKSNEEDALPILQYMNENFEKYKNASTAGVALEMDIEQYVKWVVKHYISKNEKFVITKQGANFVLFPIEKYGEYFNTTALYRIKKSGSQDVSSSSVDEVKEYFVSFDKGASLLFTGKKLYVATKKQMKLKARFLVGDKELFVSKIEDGVYYLRKLSNTRNANVIFSIQLKKDQDVNDLISFVEALN